MGCVWVYTQKVELRYWWEHGDEISSDLRHHKLKRPLKNLKKVRKSSRKNFRIAPYFIMHAHLINYAFYSLSLNKIDNSLGN